MSNQPIQNIENNQSDHRRLADRTNTTDWEGGTGPRTRSNDMHGHGVTMERHTMTILICPTNKALQVLAFWAIGGNRMVKVRTKAFNNLYAPSLA